MQWYCLLFNKFLNSSKLWEKLQKKFIAATAITTTMHSQQPFWQVITAETIGPYGRHDGWRYEQLDEQSVCLSHVHGFALSQLAQTLNIDFNTLQKCCCDVQASLLSALSMLLTSVTAMLSRLYRIAAARLSARLPISAQMFSSRLVNRKIWIDERSWSSKGKCWTGFGFCF